ncbi:hypothetical protein TrLO_g4334 [Triparma laevis f. longispina]|uniref:Thiaminase-2/PQQC domain-containing protein n=1 Tax=Triparma laevis f. longispina TaxID=1714387 RepID=A0A9W7FMM4_9STRA|nr:hypothetical protein TrLO_g4334 [Triparma laevis f. longispina]
MFTEKLQQSNSAQWQKIVQHEFTIKLAGGTLSASSLKKYLLNDHLFLDAFIVLLSSMIANCRSLEDRIPGCQFLGLVTSAENNYFEDSFKFLNVSKEERENYEMEKVAADFIAIMREAAATGSLSCCLAVLCVCEWSYSEWGTTASKNSKVKDLPHFQGWIDLHCGEYFESVVAYLKGLLDNEEGEIDAEERAKVEDLFKRTVDLEVEFFDMAMRASS